MKTCKVCGSQDLYAKRGRICRPCYNEKTRLKLAERRKDPQVRAEQQRRERERSRQRYAEDPEYRERKLNATKRRRLFYNRGSLSEQQWEGLLSLYNGLCAYCPTEATTVDHVVPFALGGEHEISNVVPACAECNSSKGDTPLVIWGGRAP